MAFCPHCMQQVRGDVYCPQCGGRLDYRAEPHQLPAGTILNGGAGQGYQIGAVLGQGGFGITYVGRENTLGRRVAIKEYFPVRCALRADGPRVTAKPGQQANYDGGMKSFLQEAKMLAALDDVPSVVHVSSYFEENGTAYLVMEYLDGLPLHRKLAAEGAIAAQALLPKFEPLLRDLVRIHAAGLIHRDISPDNIMWMPDGTLKLLDFGSARTMEDGKSMVVVLKPGFAPVEQYQSHGQGPWTDVYSLAATIYYCLTGIIPPAAPERLDSDSIQLPSACGVQISQQQEQALMWGLMVQPKQRPATMEVFAQRLYASAPAERGPEPPPPGPKAKKEKSKKGTLMQRLIAAAVALVFFGLGTFLVNRAIESRNERKRKQAMLERQSSYDTPQVVVKTPAENDQTEPEQKPEPDVQPAEPVTGQTEDGFTYRIQDGTAAITGYNGVQPSNNILGLPSDVEGVTVTRIEERAFYQNTWVQGVILPGGLEVIGAEAFCGCSDLRLLYFFTDPSFESGALDGCDNMQCLILLDGLMSEEERNDLWLPTYVMGEQTDVGQAVLFTVADNGVIYAVTDEDAAIVLHIPDDSSEITLADDIWGYPVKSLYMTSKRSAIDSLDSGTTVYMSEQLAVPYALAIEEDINWDVHADTASLPFSAQWYLTCLFAQSINETRGTGGVKILPDRQLVEASMVRVEELQQQNTDDRPDGSSWTTLLDEYDVDWAYGGFWRNATPADGDPSEYMQGTVEDWAAPLEDYDGAYYTKVGLSTAITADKYYFGAFAVVP